MYQYAVKNRAIVAFYLQETGTYEDQFRRPYTTNMNGQIYNNIVNKLDETGTITAANIAEFATDFIKPTAAPDGSVINIANGWGQRRLRFLLHIRATNNMEQYVDEYIIGYTDVPGFSLSGYLDPNMIFNVNTVCTTTIVNHKTPTGYVNYNRLNDASHLINNTSYQGITNNPIYALRPEDIYCSMEQTHLMDHLNSPNDMLIDTRGMITPASIKSKRDNAIAPIYTANLINNYVMSKSINDDPSDTYSDRQKNVLEYARSSVQAMSINENIFLSWLKIKKASNDCNTFTIKDLQEFDPNLNAVTMFIDRNSHMYNDDFNVRGNSANWNGSDIATVFATTLSQSLPSYMLQYGFFVAHFVTTNLTNGGVPVTQFVKVKTFNNHLGNAKEINALTFRIENEILRSLSYNSQLSYNIEASINLLGETKLSISINGEPSVVYTCPSFSDSLMAPVFTSNVNVVSSIANDFANIIEASTPIISNMHNKPMYNQNQNNMGGFYDQYNHNGTVGFDPYGNDFNNQNINNII